MSDNSKRIAKEGALFTVTTASGAINVLGTSFNVIDREGKFKVSCIHGSVKFLSQYLKLYTVSVQ